MLKQLTLDFARSVAQSHKRAWREFRTESPKLQAMTGALVAFYIVCGANLIITMGDYAQSYFQDGTFETMDAKRLRHQKADFKTLEELYEKIIALKKDLLKAITDSNNTLRETSGLQEEKIKSAEELISLQKTYIAQLEARMKEKSIPFSRGVYAALDCQSKVLDEWRKNASTPRTPGDLEQEIAICVNNTPVAEQYGARINLP